MWLKIIQGTFCSLTLLNVSDVEGNSQTLFDSQAANGIFRLYYSLLPS